MEKKFPLALTFDDVLIKPVASNIEPSEASTRTEVIRGLFLPLLDRLQALVE